VAFDAVVLAGGAGSRMGSDKAVLEVGGSTLLDRVLAAVAAAEQIVVVGPRRPIAMAARTGVTVTFTTEEPPGSGPAAAIVHGLALVTAPLVVVLAADVPFAATAVPRLVAAITARVDAQAAMIVDHSGRRQPLLAIYRMGALLRAADGGHWVGGSVRALIGGLAVVEVEARGFEALDCDTPGQLARARAQAQQEATMPPAG
jgi:molybdenum cofactor guanylyltransferase